jgi:hypothetical protein
MRPLRSLLQCCLGKKSIPVELAQVSTNPALYLRGPLLPSDAINTLVLESENAVFMRILPDATPFYSACAANNSTDVPPFQYTSLPGSRHIRLLKRTYGELPNTMAFDFISLPLESAADEFVAISYCWGTASTNKRLPLSDGSYIPITENVEALLTHIFTEDHDLIWLDAVCINQRDDVEKGAQVQMMKDIYASARRVSIWLGMPGEPGGIDAPSLYDGYKRFLEQFESINKDDGSTNHDFLQQGLTLIAGLVRDPWWRRVWIIQEICYAKRVWFHQGRAIFAMELLRELFEYVSILGWSLFPVWDRNSRVAMVISGDNILETIGSVRGSLMTDTLERIYGRFYNYMATDPRDRIFALLALADEASFGGCILPDYGTNAREVFSHAMAAMMSHTKDFAALGYAGIAMKRKTYSNDGLPSWVPDFASLVPYSNLSGSVNFYRAASDLQGRQMVKTGFICPALADPDLDRAHHASLQHKAPCPAEPRKPRCTAGDKDMLLLCGVLVDKVTHCGTEFEIIDIASDLGAYENTLTALAFFEVALQQASSFSVYPTQESAQEALARTLIANNASTSFKPERPIMPLAPALEAIVCSLRTEVEQGHGTEDRVWDRVISRIEGDALRESVQTMKDSIMHSRVGLERKLFWTERGCVGLGLNGIQVGDDVRLVNGANVPYITRNCKVASGDFQLLVCEAYVHGIMNGEALNFEGLKESLMILV